MSCKIFLTEIEETGPGQPLSEAASAHVEACANCRAFRDEQAALRQMIGSLEVVSAPADFDFRLRARLAAIKSEGTRPFALNRFAPGAWSMALAASFVLMIAGGVFVRQVWLSPAPIAQPENVVSVDTGNKDVPRVAPSVTPSVIETGTEPVAVKPPTTAVLPSGRVVSRPFSGRRNPAPRMEEAVSSSSSHDEVQTNDSGVRPPPPQITPPGIPDTLSQPNTLAAVPVQTSTKSTTVMLNDKQAKSHNVSLRPVTFGAQNVFEQTDIQKIFSSTTQSVW